VNSPQPLQDRTIDVICKNGFAGVKENSQEEKRKEIMRKHPPFSYNSFYFILL
jgi:hypothetical protein